MGGTQFGIPPQSINALEYAGTNLAIVPVTEGPRDPIANDKNYPIDCLWRNSVTRQLWYLSGFNVGGAIWLPFATGAASNVMFPVPNGTSPVLPDGLGNITLTDGSGIKITGGLNTIDFSLTGGGTAIQSETVDTFTAPAATAVVIPNPANGNITVRGNSVVAGTNPVRTNSHANNEFTIEVQRSQAVAGSTAANNGLSHFSNADFSVDANGFVTLAGTGGAPIQQMKGDDGVAESPLAGIFNLLGQTVTNATNAKPVFVKGSANTETTQVQVTTTSTSGAKSINNAGLASFDSTAFNVDAATGFISLVGGSSPAVEGLVPDAHTAPGTTPIVPASGNITVTGAQVAAGVVGTNVIRTDSLAANTMTIEVQRTTTAASSTVGDNGVSHFDSARFTVDANGFVSTNGTGIVKWNVINQGTEPASFAINNGYICTAGGTGNVSITLPAASALGDIIEIVLNGATSWTITQAAGQQIRWSGSTTTLGAAGTLATTGTGDSVRLVCQTANTIWVGLSGNGNLTVS